MCAAKASMRRVSMEVMYISTLNGRVPPLMRDSIAHLGLCELPGLIGTESIHGRCLKKSKYKGFGCHAGGLDLHFIGSVLFINNPFQCGLFSISAEILFHSAPNSRENIEIWHGHSHIN